MKYLNKNFNFKKLGFTFIEIVIAMSIFFIAVLPIITMYRKNITNTEDIKNETIAMFLAKRVLEVLKIDAEKDFDDFVPASEFSIKRDIVKTSNQSIYFKDDYWFKDFSDGITDSLKKEYNQFIDFQIKIDVEDYPVGSPIVEEATGKVLLKNIIVTIYYMNNNREREFVLSSLVAR
jgi:type II secretory pathway pseudopilin PulG